MFAKILISQFKDENAVLQALQENQPSDQTKEFAHSLEVNKLIELSKLSLGKSLKLTEEKQQKALEKVFWERVSKEFNIPLSKGGRWTMACSKELLKNCVRTN